MLKTELGAAFIESRPRDTRKGFIGTRKGPIKGSPVVMSAIWKDSLALSLD